MKVKLHLITVAISKNTPGSFQKGTSEGHGGVETSQETKEEKQMQAPN